MAPLLACRMASAAIGPLFTTKSGCHPPLLRRYLLDHAHTWSLDAGQHINKPSPRIVNAQQDVLQTISEPCNRNAQLDEKTDYDHMFSRRMSMAGISPEEPLAIAVSGGPDSMALCLLTMRWKLTNTNITDQACQSLIAIVVDHGLRSESTLESEKVQEWVSNLGITCKILKCTWEEGIPSPGHIQEAARKARYSLLSNECLENKIKILLTAHHSDDQAELFVLRLSRSSGPIGLAGMGFLTEIFYRPIKPAEEVHQSLFLVRPLLDFSKRDLYRVCEQAEQAWVEDPTNQNLLFVRNRIRNVLFETYSGSLRREILSAISILRQHRQCLEDARDKLLMETVHIDEVYGYAVLDIQKLSSGLYDEAVILRALGALIQFVAQKERPVRGRALTAFMKFINRSPPLQGALTLGGCYACLKPGSKSTKVLVCFSPDMPRSSRTRSSASYLNNDEESDANLGIVQKSNSSLTIDKAILSLFSESTASALITLAEDMSKDMFEGSKKIMNELRNKQSHSATTSPKMYNPSVILTSGDSAYFMDRFLVTWRNELLDTGEHTLSREIKQSCMLRKEKQVKIRHFEERDWIYISKLAKGSTEDCTVDVCCCAARLDADQTEGKPLAMNYTVRKARKALLLLKSLPIPVRRGLPVFVTEQNLLLGVPNIEFQHCPYISIVASFEPRVPLGGGRSSWL